jgi:hypothetical protein
MMIIESAVLAAITATVIGNLITIVSILFFLGVISLRYTNSSEVGAFSVFNGLLLALIFGFLLASGVISLLAWVAHAVSCMIISVVQVTVFDMREFAKRTAQRDGYSYHPSYRWIDVDTVYDGIKPVGGKAKVNRSELTAYVIAYMLVAPFLVIHWAFHEVISGIGEWISSNLMGRLQKRLDRMM